MKVLSNILIGIVAILHFAFLVLEMLPSFALTVQTKLASLGLSSEELITKLVANTGLYNGFLAAGLFWVLVATPNKRSTQAFFLVCVIIAGLYGGLVIKETILLFQALPAILALFTVGMSWNYSKD